MANIEHSGITDPNIHEPKGITLASANEVYVANGSATGSWKGIYTQGWEDVANTGSAQALTDGVWLDLTNNGLGANSNDTYLLPGFSSVWDTATNEFDWASAGLSLGDTVDIRFDFTFVTNAANDEVALRLDLAHGDAGEYSLEFFRQAYKTAGTYRTTVSYNLYMGNSITLNNPTRIAAISDSAGDTVLLNGFYARVIPRRPVYL